MVPPAHHHLAMTCLVLLLLGADCHAQLDAQSLARAHELLRSNAIAHELLRVTRVVGDDAETVVWAEQLHGGLPVFFADIGYMFDNQGRLETFPEGSHLPSGNPPINRAAIGIELVPALDAGSARTRFIELYPSFRSVQIAAELGLFDLDAFEASASDGPFVLVWGIRTKPSGTPAAIIDAHSAEVLWHDDGIRTGMTSQPQELPLPNCARSFCGCWTSITRELTLMIRGAFAKPLAGIELRCTVDGPLLATSDAIGVIRQPIRVQMSPGCGLGQCRELMLLDPRGQYVAAQLPFPSSPIEVELTLAQSDARAAGTDRCSFSDETGPTTVELRRCAEQNFTIAKSALDAYVGQLIANSNDEDPDFAALLEKAQQAWLSGRDATCELVYRAISPGSFASVQRLDCLAAETAHRLERLRAIYSPPDDALPH